MACRLRKFEESMDPEVKTNIENTVAFLLKTSFQQGSSRRKGNAGHTSDQAFGSVDYCMENFSKSVVDDIPDDELLWCYESCLRESMVDCYDYAKLGIVLLAFCSRPRSEMKWDAGSVFQATDCLNVILFRIDSLDSEATALALSTIQLAELWFDVPDKHVRGLFLEKCRLISVILAARSFCLRLELTSRNYHLSRDQPDIDSDLKAYFDRYYSINNGLVLRSCAHVRELFGA